MIRRLLFALFGLAFCFAPVRGQIQIPSPANSTVSPADFLGGVIVCPDQPSQIPAAIETITVRNTANNPLPNIPVRLCVCAAPPLIFCPGQGPCWFGVSNANGQVQFSLGAGGCCIQANAARVEWFDGINWNPLRIYPWVKSPDYNGVNGNRVVNLADLVFFFPPGPAKPCTMYGSSLLGNIMIFASAYIPANHCP